MSEPTLIQQLALLLTLGVAVAPTKAEEAPEKAAERAATVAHLTKVVENFSISIGDEQPEPLELVKSPVLHYSDQISPVTDGLVFVWTKAARPEAIMALHPGTKGHTWIEFKSLSASPLSAVRHGHTEWRPRNAGVEFKPFADAPTPESTTTKRLAQMRSLLRPFTASVMDNAKGRQELRLLTQPLYRYSQPDSGILDGGVFAFVLSTNPELLVVLEAQTPNNKPQWVYSIARFSGRETELRLQDRPIWPASDLPSTKDPSASFFQLRSLIADE